MTQLQSAFAGMSLRSSGLPRGKQPFVSNGTVQRVAMKSKKTFQVEVRPGGLMQAGPAPHVRAQGCLPAAQQRCYDVKLPEELGRRSMAPRYPLGALPARWWWATRRPLISP